MLPPQPRDLPGWPSSTAVCVSMAALQQGPCHTARKLACMVRDYCHVALCYDPIRQQQQLSTQACVMCRWCDVLGPTLCLLQVLQLSIEQPLVQPCAGLHPVQPIHGPGSDQFYSSCRSVQQLSEAQPVLDFIRQHADKLVGPATGCTWLTASAISRAKEAGLCSSLHPCGLL